MPPKRRRPSELPQTVETWGLLATRLRAWIAVAGQLAQRPFLVLALDLDHDRILYHNLLEQPPTSEDVERALAEAMTKPARGSGKPRRPTTVRLADPELAQALAPALERVGVAGEAGPLPELEAAVRLLEEHLRGDQPEHPSLLSVPGATPEMVGSLFAAAAGFYRAAPWVQLNNGQTFALQAPAGSGPRWIASVMGNGGMEYGLAVYQSWAAFEKAFAGVGDPRELLSGQLAVWYGGPEILPFDEFEAAERYGWDVAGSQAYPMPVLMITPERLDRPSAGQLRWLEAALRAIPQLVQGHLRPAAAGEYQPFETTLSVTTAEGPVAVQAAYPGGQLSLEQQPVYSDDWEWDADESDDEPPAFDRRAMEGMLAQLGLDIGAEEAITDPKLRKAQALMYKAWEEANPAKRLSYAHRALATSPDCADAYLLLAEEEADSRARAAELYQQGVAAGERALGPAFFQENSGHFWGLLETRPYMRAREGLAQTLWSLGRRDEAATHYRALLALNPDDNQGSRYALLNLLLELERYADAAALLKQYKDNMAEWRYTGALLAFRKSGRGPGSDRRLKAALKQNPLVPAYLTGKKRLPGKLPPYYGYGDEAEAIHYAHRYLAHWRRTPGAVEWLAGLSS